MVTQFFSGLASRFGTGPDDEAASQIATIEPRLSLPNPQALYEFCKVLYYNDSEPYGPVGDDYEGVQGFRNPVMGQVEFYVATLFPGDLDEAFPLKLPDSAPATLGDRIDDVWHNSNWVKRKQAYVRTTSMLGDGFLQAAVRTNRAGEVVGSFMAIVPAEQVTNFETDERGFLTYIRLDIPRMRELTSRLSESYLRTEVWDKRTGRVRRWESSLNTPATQVDELAGLVFDDPIERFGIDFLPFTHAKFLDDDYPRGLAAPMMALRKSAEASRMAHELHEKLFRYNQPDIQLAGGLRDPDGYIVPPRQIDWEQPTERSIAGYRRVAIPPVGHELKGIDSSVNYQAHQEAIGAMLANIQETDLPELAWYQRNDTDESGRALRIKLTPAISRAEEVRGNLEPEVIRAQQMCLTLAQVHDIPGFSADEIGTFDAGDFAHTFIKRDVLPMTEDERAEIRERNARAAKALAEAGYDRRWIAEHILGLDERAAAEAIGTGLEVDDE